MLVSGRSVIVSEILVEGSEGAFSPDDKASKMASRSELEEIESGNSNGLNSRNITEGTSKVTLFSVDNKRTTSLYISSVSQLSLSGANLLRILDVLDVFVGSELLEQSNGVLSLLEPLEASISNDERNFGDLLDSVSTSKNERGKSSSSKGGSNCESSLVEVDFSVPFSVNLVGSEHTSSTTHVSEGSLT
jgi:hypothetical protein